MKVPERFNFARDVVEAFPPDGYALTFVDAAGAVSRLTWGEIAAGAAPLVGGARGARAAAGRPRARARRQDARLAPDPPRRAAAGPRHDPVLGDAPCQGPRVPDGPLRRLAPRRAPRCGGRGRRDERALPRRSRGRRGRPGVRGHARRRAGVHPLHLGHDEGSEGRHAHARVHVREADAGRALARRAARRPRLVHGGDGLGEVDLERLPRPVEPGRRDPPPRGRRSTRASGSSCSSGWR